MNWTRHIVFFLFKELDYIIYNQEEKDDHNKVVDKYIYFVKCKIRKTNRLFKETEFEFRKMDRRKKEVLKIVGLEFKK